MFICKKCCELFEVRYDTGNYGEAVAHFERGWSKSRGPCEICHVQSVCADIKSNRLRRKTEPVVNEDYVKLENITSFDFTIGYSKGHGSGMLFLKGDDRTHFDDWVKPHLVEIMNEWDKQNE